MIHSPDTDRELVDAVLNGNTDAYRVLVERESMSVVNVCARILRDPDEAQDVAQDAFVQAYRSLASYRGDGTFGAWLGRIATRIAVERAGAQRRLQTTADMPLELLSDEARVDPEWQLLNSENSSALRRAIDGLPSDQREVVALRFYEELSIDAIAAKTGAPVGTVKSRLHRALVRLRNETDLRSAS